MSSDADRARAGVRLYLLGQRDEFFAHCSYEHPAHDDTPACVWCQRQRTCSCVWCILAMSMEDAISAVLGGTTEGPDDE